MSIEITRSRCETEQINVWPAYSIFPDDLPPEVGIAFGPLYAYLAPGEARARALAMALIEAADAADAAVSEEGPA